MKNYKFKIFFFFFLCLVVVVLDYFNVLDPIRGYLEEKLVIPIRLAVKPKPVVCPEVKSSQEKEAEILDLKTQIAVLREENLAEKKLLGSPYTPQTWSFLAARVIGISGEEIIIDQGKDAGIIEGTPVLAEGYFLGKVEKVTPKMAKIKVLSSPGNKMFVKILAKEGMGLTGKGLLEGMGEEKMTIKQILSRENVNEGDLVVAADSSETVDLLVGKITKVDYQIGEPFKLAEVRTGLTISELQNVFLKINKN